MSTESEKQAIELSNNRQLLLKQLKSAKSCLKDEDLFYFKRTVFDFENKRLVGTDGYFLQWQLRPDPNSPESYENQQTNRGTVYFYRTLINPEAAQ